jgi:hypothetical protein
MPRPHLTPRKDPVPIVQEAEWVSGSAWTVAENLATTGIRSPDRPTRRQSLYRLSYPAHFYINWCRCKHFYILWFCFRCHWEYINTLFWTSCSLKIATAILVTLRTLTGKTTGKCTAMGIRRLTGKWTFLFKQLNGNFALSVLRIAKNVFCGSVCVLYALVPFA